MVPAVLVLEGGKMKLIEHFKKAEREGKPFKRFFFLLLVNGLVPTPSLGFILGGITTILLTWFIGGILEVAPLGGALMAGGVVAALAIIWQRIYDSYWGRQ
jgi:hypothetical protein